MYDSLKQKFLYNKRELLININAELLEFICLDSTMNL